MIFIDAGTINFTVEAKWTDLTSISINYSHWCLFWWAYNGKEEKIKWQKN